MPTPRFSLPMYFPAAPFALADAVDCAALVDSAYDQCTQWVNQGMPRSWVFKWCKPKNSGKTYNYSPPLFWTVDWLGTTYDEPFGFVAQDIKTSDVYLVFRGTVTNADWLQDGLVDQTPYQLAPDYGQVHTGFYEIYTGLNQQIYAFIADFTGFKRFFFTGHSLGCGLSSLAVPDVITNTSVKPGNLTVMHYNLASPRVGDPQYAYTMNTNKVPTYRIVNTEDLVPDGPAPFTLGYVYKHIGIPVDFTATYDSTGDNHAHDTCYQYAVCHPDNPEGPIPPPPPLGIAPRPGVRLTWVDGKVTRVAKPAGTPT